MSQTIDEVVRKTSERWRFLETEEVPSFSTAIPLVAHLGTCRFYNTKLDLEVVTCAGRSINGRYELSASPCGSPTNKKKEVKDFTGLRRGMKGRKAAHCSARQLLEREDRLMRKAHQSWP